MECTDESTELSLSCDQQDRSNLYINCIFQLNGLGTYVPTYASYVDCLRVVVCLRVYVGLGMSDRQRVRVCEHTCECKIG